ncbi:hypothetical protein BHE74_00059227, partial [Ensete ventricosum]
RWPPLSPASRQLAKRHCRLFVSSTGARAAGKGWGSPASGAGAGNCSALATDTPTPTTAHSITRPPGERADCEGQPSHKSR